MKPNDCPQRDWPLYYNNTFMHHDEYGMVLVQVINDGTTFEVQYSDTYTTVEPSTLSPIWPVAQAINLTVYNTAVYIGRRARREARRSCTAHHYNILWSKGRSLVIDRLIMRHMTEPQEKPNIPTALEMMLNGMASVAISHDLIIYPAPGEELALVCRGTEVGRLVRKDDVIREQPDIENSPLARRVQFKLDKEGLLCHLT